MGNDKQWVKTDNGEWQTMRDNRQWRMIKNEW